MNPIRLRRAFNGYGEGEKMKLLFTLGLLILSACDSGESSKVSYSLSDIFISETIFSECKSLCLAKCPEYRMSLKEVSMNLNRDCRCEWRAPFGSNGNMTENFTEKEVLEYSKLHLIIKNEVPEQIEERKREKK